MLWYNIHTGYRVNASNEEEKNLVGYERRICSDAFEGKRAIAFPSLSSVFQKQKTNKQKYITYHVVNEVVEKLL